MRRRWIDKRTEELTAAQYFASSLNNELTGCSKRANSPAGTFPGKRSMTSFATALADGPTGTRACHCADLATSQFSAA